MHEGTAACTAVGCSHNRQPIEAGPYQLTHSSSGSCSLLTCQLQPPVSELCVAPLAFKHHLGQCGILKQWPQCCQHLVTWQFTTHCYQGQLRGVVLLPGDDLDMLLQLQIILHCWGY